MYFSLYLCHTPLLKRRKRSWQSCPALSLGPECVGHRVPLPIALGCAGGGFKFQDQTKDHYTAQLLSTYNRSLPLGLGAAQEGIELWASPHPMGLEVAQS